MGIIFSLKKQYEVLNKLSMKIYVNKEYFKAIQAMDQ